MIVNSPHYELVNPQFDKFTNFSKRFEKSPILDLPSEIFSLISTHLPNDDLLNFRLACRKIDIAICTRVNESALQTFERVDGFLGSRPEKFFNVTSCKLKYRWDCNEQYGVHWPEQLTSQTKKLARKEQRDQLVMLISMLPNLESLCLECEGLNEPAFRILISEVQNLKELEIAFSALGDLTLKYTNSHLGNLKSLILIDNAYLTDRSLAKLLKAASQLEVLSNQKMSPHHW